MVVWDEGLTIDTKEYNAVLDAFLCHAIGLYVAPDAQTRKMLLLFIKTKRYADTKIPICRYALELVAKIKSEPNVAAAAEWLDATLGRGAVSIQSMCNSNRPTDEDIEYIKTSILPKIHEDSKCIGLYDGGDWQSFMEAIKTADNNVYVYLSSRTPDESVADGSGVPCVLAVPPTDGWRGAVELVGSSLRLLEDKKGDRAKKIETAVQNADTARAIVNIWVGSLEQVSGNPKTREVGCLSARLSESVSIAKQLQLDAEQLRAAIAKGGGATNTVDDLRSSLAGVVYKLNAIIEGKEETKKDAELAQVKSELVAMKSIPPPAPIIIESPVEKDKFSSIIAERNHALDQVEELRDRVKALESNRDSVLTNASAKTKDSMEAVTRISEDLLESKKVIRSYERKMSELSTKAEEGEKFKRMAEKLQANLKTYDSDVRSYKDKVEVLEKQLSRYDEVAAKKANVEAKKHEAVVKGYKDRIAELEGENEVLRNKFTVNKTKRQLEDTIYELEQKVKSAEAASERDKKRADEVEQKVSKYKSRVGGTQETSTKLEKEVEELRARCSVAEKKAGDVEQKVSKYKTRAKIGETAQEVTARLTKEVEDWKAKCALAEKKSTEIEQKVTKYKSRARQVSETASAPVIKTKVELELAGKELEEWKARCALAEKTAQDTKRQLATVYSIKDAAISNFDRQIKEMKLVNGEKDKMSAEIDSLRAKLTVAESDRESVVAGRSDLMKKYEEQISTLQEQLRAAESNLSKHEADMELMQQALENARAGLDDGLSDITEGFGIKISETKVQMDALMAENQELKTKCAEYKKEIADLRDTVTRLHADRIKLMKQMSLPRD